MVGCSKTQGCAEGSTPRVPWDEFKGLKLKRESEMLYLEGEI